MSLWPKSNTYGDRYNRNKASDWFWTNFPTTQWCDVIIERRKICVKFRIRKEVQQKSASKTMMVWIKIAAPRERGSSDSVESIFQCDCMPGPLARPYVLFFGLPLTWAKSTVSGDTARMLYLGSPEPSLFACANSALICLKGNSNCCQDNSNKQ